MSDNITIAITLKNRAVHLDNHLHYLVNYQEYDMKKVEISITDGFSTDHLLEVIEKWYKHFYQIRFATSDRSILPFKIPTNNPACDINAQICNCVTFDKVLRTDAEVLYPTNTLAIVNDALQESSDRLLWWTNYSLAPEYKYNMKSTRMDNPENKSIDPKGVGGLCYAFIKDVFIEMGGIDEGFALGFAWEDTHFKDNWSQYKPLLIIDQPVYHFDHSGYIVSMDENMRLWNTVSYPLYMSLLQNKIKPNFNNMNWKRKEMIGGERIWKE